MTADSIATNITYENLLVSAKLPLSALSAERLARILRNNFGTRIVTARQFEAAVRRYHAGVVVADEQYLDDTSDDLARTDYRQFNPKEKRSIRYRIAEGQSAASISRELGEKDDSIGNITQKVRQVIKSITL